MSIRDQSDGSTLTLAKRRTPKGCAARSAENRSITSACLNHGAEGCTIANNSVHGTNVALQLERLWDRNVTIATRLVHAVSISLLFEILCFGSIDA